MTLNSMQREALQALGPIFDQTYSLKNTAFSVSKRESRVGEVWTLLCVTEIEGRPMLLQTPLILAPSGIRLEPTVEIISKKIVARKKNSGVNF